MSSTSDSETELKPDIVTKDAQAVVENLTLTPMSKERYMKSYSEFMKWRAKKRLISLSESVFLIYFNELSEKLQPSTLWSTFSMLKTVINTEHDVNIKGYAKLISFLKEQSHGFKCKRSKVFNAQQVETFLNKAPDEIYLATKVALIIGISGACRSNELTNLTLDNIEKHGQIHLVKLPNTKTKYDRTFVVRDEFGQIVQKYQELRPDNLPTNRFFLNYQRGKCLKQVIGRNKISGMPKEIAAYLNLPNPDLYTGHCFRRTSAALLADSGADLTMLKRHGRKKLKTVAEGIIENSPPPPLVKKSKIPNNITETIYLPSTSPQPGSSKDNREQLEELTDSVDWHTNETMPSPTFNADEQHEELTNSVDWHTNETTPSSTFNVDQQLKAGLNDTQISQNVSNINIPGKNLSLTITNCTNFTINFN